MNSDNFSKFFPFSKEDINKLLVTALSKGGEYADLFFEHRYSFGTVLEEDLIKSTSNGIVYGAGIRVVNGEQVGYAYSEDLTLEKIKSACVIASHIATDCSKTISPINVSDKTLSNYYPIEIPSNDIKIEEKIKLLYKANDCAKNYDSKINKVVVSFTESIKHIMIATSTGEIVKDVQPMLLLRVRCIASDNDNRQTAMSTGGKRIGFEYFKGDRVKEIAEDSAKLAVSKLTAVDAPAGQMEVVLGAGDSGILLHEAVGHGLEADFNRKNISNFSGQIGQKVASELCTVVDDGSIPNRRGSINIDDEASYKNGTVLIENGILKQYLNDRISGKIMKTKLTGNGRRQSYKHVPLPRMTNTLMKAGKSHPDEIISSVKKGIYAKRFGGGQVDITKGDFVFELSETYLIENGKITYPLKNVSVIGNGPDVMKKIVLVGNDLEYADGGWTCGKAGQQVPVGMGMPTCKISSMTVGGSINT